MEVNNQKNTSVNIAKSLLSISASVFVITISYLIYTNPQYNFRIYNDIKLQNKQEHQGAIYVVAGSASKVDNGPLDHPAHHMGLLEAGSMVIDINNNKLVARFINHRGQVWDAFSISKDDQYVSGYQGCN